MDETTRTAFRALYAAHVDHVWRTLRRLGVHPADLDDATQRVFLVVHQHWSRLDPERPVRPWLTGIAYKVAAGERRRARHHRERLTDLPELEAHQAAGMTAEEQLIQRERAARVLAALQLLPAKRRIVFIMHELDEQPAPAIAEALDIPLNTVYSRLRVARQEFTRAITDTLRGASPQPREELA